MPSPSRMLCLSTLQETGKKEGISKIRLLQDSDNFNLICTVLVFAHAWIASHLISSIGCLAVPITVSAFNLPLLAVLEKAF